MNDPLFTNKIAAAGLTALLLIFGIPILVHNVLGGHGGHHGEKEAWPFPHYPALDIGAGAGGGAEEEAPLDLGTLLANASAGSGERRSAICASCHTFDRGGAQGAGPNLWDIVGRPVANVAGFNYSGALSGLGGTWTYERLDGYLKDSQAYLPGTAMVQRFPRDNQRADLLAYLQTLSDNPVPFPAPVVVEEAPVEEEAASETEGVIEEAAAAVGGAIEDAGAAVEDAAEAVVNTVEDAGEAVVDAAEDAVDATQEAIDPNGGDNQ